MEKRVYNFSPGPAVLPLPALEEAQRDLVALPGAGISILEISHRSKQFGQIIEQAEANLRTLLAIPDNYRVLFLQGGALLQFGMIPMNFLRNTGKPADYIVTGTWSKKAADEAKTQGDVRTAWDGKATNYDRVPQPGELKLEPVGRVRLHDLERNDPGRAVPHRAGRGRRPAGLRRLVRFPFPARAHRPLRPVLRLPQKNAGPAGVTIVVIRDDLVANSPNDLPSLLNYTLMAENKSLLNTPPVFAIYMVKLVTDWLLKRSAGWRRCRRSTARRRSCSTTRSTARGGFYQAHAQPACRSMMNVPFRLADAALDEPFLKEAAGRGLCELKGHRSVGGCRASIYNAMPREGVELLRDFMREFAEKHGK